LDRDPDAQELLDRFHVNAADVPVLICRGEAVLRSPSNRQIAACLGFNDAIDQTHVSDLLIVGRGGRRGWRPRCMARPKPRCPRARIELARTPGGIELQN